MHWDGQQNCYFFVLASDMYSGTRPLDDEHHTDTDEDEAMRYFSMLMERSNWSHWGSKPHSTLRNLKEKKLNDKNCTWGKRVRCEDTIANQQQAMESCAFSIFTIAQYNEKQSFVKCRHYIPSAAHSPFASPLRISDGYQCNQFEMFAKTI